MRDPAGATPPPPSRRAAKIVFGLAALLLAVLGVAAVWLAAHAFDQSDHFAEPRQLAQRSPGPEIVAGGQVHQRVRLTDARGLAVDLRLIRPAASGGPWPVVVLLGGHRTGRDAVELIGEADGMIIAALDYPYHGPERIRGVRQVLGSIPAIQRGLLDTPPAVSLVLDWLVEQPWADAARLELMGVSLGVPFAAVAGALDTRFRRVWLVHGGVDNRAWLGRRLESRIAQPWLREAAASLLHLLAYGPTFRTERWAAQIAPRELVVVGASDDEQMPPAEVRQLHAVAREPKELLWTEGRHVGPRRPEVIRQILALARSRIVAAPAGSVTGS